MAAPWQIAVDTGGTFTDVRLVDPDGIVSTLKVLSSGVLRARVVEVVSPGHGDTLDLKIDHRWPGHLSVLVGFEGHLVSRAGRIPLGQVTAFGGSESLVRFEEFPPDATPAPSDILELTADEEAPVVAARLGTGTAPGESFPGIDFRLASTRGTNALLEGKGAPVVLFTNQGLGDLLELRDQRRPDLFARAIEKAIPLAKEVVEISGRLDATGQELEIPDWNQVEQATERLYQEGFREAAVALLHSDLDPRHEQRVGEILKSAGFEHIALSSDMARRIKLLPRAETAVVDAALGPVVARFVAGVQQPLGPQTRLLLMTSAGHLEPPEIFSPKSSLLSGPAGGVVGAWNATRRLGRSRAVAFDMGGTSTDVSRLDGGPRRVFDHAVGAGRVMTPALHIETVAAGGGSICRLGLAGLLVGPESAGADPGPACYGKGGPLTVTDVNLLLGRLPDGRVGLPLDHAAAERAFADLQNQITEREGVCPPRRQLLEGLLEIAVERMADAVRRISVAEGADPADHLLVAFGGAGPQHATAVASRLGIREVLVPEGAGILSAVGLGEARIERWGEHPINQPLLEVAGDFSRLLRESQHEARKQCEVAGLEENEMEKGQTLADLRLLGQEATLSIELVDQITTASELAVAFAEAYAVIFGLEPGADEVIEWVALRSSACARAATKPTPQSPSLPKGAKPVSETTVLAEAHCTIVLEVGWSATPLAEGDLLLQHHSDSAPLNPLNRAGAIGAELFRGRFQAVVDEMGAQLQRTAFSPNIRERLDYSCALLDAQGHLVASAPHIPVHLGALGECVRRVVTALPLGAGDVAVTNHPGYGGSHLPDVTVISPVHDDHGQLAGYLANRAHHAEIGGLTPGSMPPAARSLEEEGVVIHPCLLVRAGDPRYGEMEKVLREATYPSRDPASNLSDLRSQVAANLRGVERFQNLISASGREEIEARLEEQLTRSEHAFARILKERSLSPVTVSEPLDDGHPLVVSIKPGPPLVVDFNGSGPVHTGNFNAPPAVGRSAVLYALRLLLDEELPLNEGLMRSVDLGLPEGTFLAPNFPDDPAHCPPVVAGNVETSQQMVNLLLRAFGVVAAGQGTMNNFLFGNHRFGYYETIGGGAGAGPGFTGASAVHSHMTNTAITDPEVLERRFPVRLREFSVRRGSGGAGRWQGGDGIVREIEFLEPMTVSIVAQQRNRGPRGTDGGADGSPGAQWILRSDAPKRKVQGSFEVQTAEAIRIETPGGGGWGRPELGSAEC